MEEVPLNSRSSLLSADSAAAPQPRRRKATAVVAVGVLLALFVGAAVAVGVVFGGRRQPQPNVVLFIGDGLGPQMTTLSRLFAAHAKLHEPLRGAAAAKCRLSLVSTSSASHTVTDSAAAATAMSCGLKTVNGFVGVTPDGTPCGTVLEAAALAGMATGVAVTSTVSHATPAGFTAHVGSRLDETGIARQQLQQFADGRLNVAIGGGKDVWEDAGLLERARELGVVVALNLSQISEAVASPEAHPLLAVLGQGKLAYEIDLGDFRADVEASGSDDPLANDERPTMSEIADAAWHALKKTKRPFFLMVEGSLIDFAGHANDAAAAIWEALSFFHAITNILRHAQQDGNTIVLVTADHDTGGLSLGSNAINFDLLNTANASIETMAKLMVSGSDVSEVLRTRAGIDNLSAEELERLEKAKNTSEAVLQDEIALVVADRVGISWGTDGHTATNVLLYSCLAEGNDVSLVMDNTDIPFWIADVLGLDINATTADTLRRFNATSLHQERSVCPPGEPAAHCSLQN